MNPRPHSLDWVMCGQPKRMTNTTAKAQLLDLLIEPLKGCKGVYAHRQNLMQRVMRMPDQRCATTSIASGQAICQAPEASRTPGRNS